MYMYVCMYMISNYNNFQVILIIISWTWLLDLDAVPLNCANANQEIAEQVDVEISKPVEAALEQGC